MLCGAANPAQLIWLGTKGKNSKQKHERQLTPVPSGTAGGECAAGPPGGGGSDVGSQGVTCISCGRSFATKRGLGVHVARVHKSKGKPNDRQDAESNVRQDTGTEAGRAEASVELIAAAGVADETLQKRCKEGTHEVLPTTASLVADWRSLESSELTAEPVPIRSGGRAATTRSLAAPTQQGSVRYSLRSRAKAKVADVPSSRETGVNERSSLVTPTSVRPLAGRPEGAFNAPVRSVKGSGPDGRGVLPDEPLDVVHVAALEGAINIPVAAAGRSTHPSAASPAADDMLQAGPVAWEATGARPKVFLARTVEHSSCSANESCTEVAPSGASFFSPPVDAGFAPADADFAATRGEHGERGVDSTLLGLGEDVVVGGDFVVGAGEAAHVPACGVLSTAGLSSSSHSTFVSCSDGSVDSSAAPVGLVVHSSRWLDGSQSGDAPHDPCLSVAVGPPSIEVPGPALDEEGSSSSAALRGLRPSVAGQRRDDDSSSSSGPVRAQVSKRPLPRQLRALLSDSSDDAIPTHHTCKECGRAFSSLIGLSQHRRHAHFNAYNADIVVTRVKPRWSKEESFLLAKKEAELTRKGVRNLNQQLHFHFQGRTFDSIKSHRRDPGYRNLVKELLGTTDRVQASRPQPSGSEDEVNGPTANAPEPIDMRRACLEEISKLVSTACPRGYGAPKLWEIGKQLLDGRNIGMELNNYIRNNFFRDKRSPPRRTVPGTTSISNRKRRKQEFAQLQQLFRKDQARAAKQVLDGQLSSQIDDPEGFLQDWKTVMESRCDDPWLPNAQIPTRADRNPMGPITAQDIKYAFPAANSSPGPDGFTARELKRVPVVILQLLYNILLTQKRLPVTLASARTVFIPKVDGASTPSQFRPITVAPVLLRLFHKIFANRLQAMALLDCRQRAFIPADGCAENVHLLGTVLHEARRKRRALFMASVDIAKAFDSVTLEALLAALARKGIAVEFREYIKMFYGMASTVLSFQDSTLSVRPSRGVRQGDPMSPILFNLVVDEFLEEHCEERIAFVSATGTEELKVSGMAFADDLLLFASTEAGLQCKLTSLRVFLRKRGLVLNPGKCLSLAMIPAGKEKLVKVDPSVRFYVDNQVIPAAEGETAWKYLGISFSSRGAFQKPVHSELKGYLDNVGKAALKPQQRLVLLRFYLLPRLYHRLILGPVSRRTLLRLDKTIRASVRNWLKLPHDVPLGAFHARVPEGGLGIPNMRTAIPYLRVRRLEAMAVSEYTASKKAYKMDYVQGLLRQSRAMMQYRGSVIDSKKSCKKFWTSYLHSSTDGAALREVANAPGASSWLAEGTRFLSGREFINSVRVRFNTVPTLVRLKRAQDVPKTCRAGCDQEETLGHILQKCHRTHHTRIQRHDAVVRYAAKRCRELGFEVLEEPHYRTRLGTRIPDLVLKRDGQALVLDAQVVGCRVRLSDAHLTKTSKYMHHELCALVSRDVRPLVSTLTLSYRGVWARESVDTLRSLGFTANDFKIMTIRVLQGGWRCFAVHQRMTTTLSGRSRGRGAHSHTSN